MPVYCYSNGYQVVEQVFSIGNAPKVIELDGVEFRRDFGSEHVGVPASQGWPMECIASGVHASQAGELRKHFSDRGVPTDVSRDGNPVYRDAAHRRKALKARGLVDRSSFL